MREGTRIAILQYAIDTVKGTKLEDWQKEELKDILSDPKKKEAYDSDLKSLQAYMDEVGPEKFSQTEFDIPYNYNDDEDDDDDDPWGPL